MTTLTHPAKLHAQALHRDFHHWADYLTFCKDEIAQFQKLLFTVASRNNSREFHLGLSHWQCQIIIQDEQADIHLHLIGREEQKLRDDQQVNPVAADHRLYPDPMWLRKRMETHQHIFQSFKTDVRAFIGRWM